MRNLIAVVALATVLACGKNAGTDDAGADGETSPTVATATTAPPPPAMSGVQLAPVSFAPIAKQADPSVVTVNVIVNQIVETWGGRRMRREGKGLGTGFIVDKDGTILTNNHVVAEGGTEAEAISVKLSSGRELPARVVGRDQPTDIAVIHIDPTGLDLKPLPLGDSDAIIVASYVDKFRDEFQAHIDHGGCPFGGSSSHDHVLAPVAMHSHSAETEWLEGATHG